MFRFACMAAAAFGLSTAMACAGGVDLPDAGVFTTYQVSADKTSIAWSTCGTVPGSSGCFGSGTLTPFAHVCAVLQTAPVTKGLVVSRDLFVLDARRASPVLNVFRRKNTYIDGAVLSSVTLRKRIALSMPGGVQDCYMAASATKVFAGVASATGAAAIDIASLSVAPVPGFSPPETVTGITADERGYVSVQYSGGYYLYAPGGGVVQDGGGTALLFNPTNATLFNR